MRWAERDGEAAAMTQMRGMAAVALALMGSCAGLAIAAVGARAAGAAPLVPAALGALVGAAAAVGLGATRLAAKLPAAGFARRWQWVAWLIVAVLAVANTVRVGLFVAEPSQTWASAFPPLPDTARHVCLTAYVHAGELAARGQANLWNPADYDGDGYEYPPPFAMLPRAAVALSGDLHVLRPAWFAISALGFWIAFLALTIWLRSRTALRCLPVVALSIPTVFDLQYGQAHLLVVAAAIAGMLQLARGRRTTGALLLGAAIATKLFPALLVVHLVVRRRWADAIAVGAATLALFGLAVVVLGADTTAAFVHVQLPRLASGEAFPFVANQTDNDSLYGLAYKLIKLGVVDSGQPLAGILAWLWTLFAVALTVAGSRGPASRTRDGALWLGVLCLATLRAPYVPAYARIGTLWLLSTVPPRRMGWFVLAWLVLQGAPPVLGPAANVILSLPSQIASIALAVAAVWPRRGQMVRGLSGNAAGGDACTGPTSYQPS